MVKATGEFFDPVPTGEHRCFPPPYRTKNGWRCDCGRAYVFESLHPREVNQGELNWQWRRAPEHDKRTKKGLFRD